MGSPLESASWNGVEGVYYTGAGSSEALWLFVSITICVVALVAGLAHEKMAYHETTKNEQNH